MLPRELIGEGVAPPHPGMNTILSMTVLSFE